MRVADYIANRLAAAGLEHVFLVTGGGAMHLNDAFGRQKDLTCVCLHHEQGCAMAAEAYARLGGKPAVLNVTTGPGGINALNGVFGAYTDSIPMIVISGQVRRETIAGRFPIGLRQLGDQEVDIARMVGGITKYAVTVMDPHDIRYEVEKALHLAVTGRPGPTWVDVPIDIQGANIDPDTLRGFDPLSGGLGPMAVPTEAGSLTGEALRGVVRTMLARLSQAKRPCILPGTGVRIAGAADRFLRVVERLGAPVATAFNAHDLMGNDHPLYAGRAGTVGDRSGNFAVQNADFLLVLGCRLNIRQISYNWDSFAREAFQVMVDIDKAELTKPTLSIDLPIHADLNAFLDALERELDAAGSPAANPGEYLAWCRERMARYPVVEPAYWDTPAPVNPYCFASELFNQLDADDVVVTGDGTACVVTFQSANLKQGQRLFSNSGSASMGYDVPAAIGAWYANPKAKRIICIAGDGSVMMNLQELQTIIGQRLPVKVFVLNNDGYHSIRQTQQNYFPDNVVGCGPESGVTFPDFVKLGAAFGFPVSRIDAHAGMGAAIAAVVNREGPALCEVMLDKAQPFAPKLSSRRLEDGSMVTSALEDLAPFLSREELAENMLIAPAKG